MRRYGIGLAAIWGGKYGPDRAARCSARIGRRGRAPLGPAVPAHLAAIATSRDSVTFSFGACTVRTPAVQLREHLVGESRRRQLEPALELLREPLMEVEGLALLLHRLPHALADGERVVADLDGRPLLPKPGASSSRL